MDKRNRPALAYLLVGVASAGRAMLAMPDAVALQEVSLTVLALVGYLLLGRRALPVLADCGCRAAGRVLRCTLFCRGGHRGVLCLHRVQHHAAVVRRAAAARLQYHPREKVSPRLVETGIVCYTI